MQNFVVADFNPINNCLKAEISQTSVSPTHIFSPKSIGFLDTDIMGRSPLFFNIIDLTLDSKTGSSVFAV